MIIGHHTDEETTPVIGNIQNDSNIEHIDEKQTIVAVVEEGYQTRMIATAAVNNNNPSTGNISLKDKPNDSVMASTQQNDYSNAQDVSSSALEEKLQSLVVSKDAADIEDGANDNPAHDGDSLKGADPLRSDSQTELKENMNTVEPLVTNSDQPEEAIAVEEVTPLSEVISEETEKSGETAEKEIDEENNISEKVDNNNLQNPPSSPVPQPKGGASAVVEAPLEITKELTKKENEEQVINGTLLTDFETQQPEVTSPPENVEPATSERMEQRNETHLAVQEYTPNHQVINEESPVAEGTEQLNETHSVDQEDTPTHEMPDEDRPPVAEDNVSKQNDTTKSDDAAPVLETDVVEEGNASTTLAAPEAEASSSIDQSANTSPENALVDEQISGVSSAPTLSENVDQKQDKYDATTDVSNSGEAEPLQNNEPQTISVQSHVSDFSSSTPESVDMKKHNAETTPPVSNSEETELPHNNEPQAVSLRTPDETEVNVAANISTDTPEPNDEKQDQSETTPAVSNSGESDPHHSDEPQAVSVRTRDETEGNSTANISNDTIEPDDQKKENCEATPLVSNNGETKPTQNNAAQIVNVESHVADVSFAPTPETVDLKQDIFETTPFVSNSGESELPQNKEPHNVSGQSPDDTEANVSANISTSITEPYCQKRVDSETTPAVSGSGETELPQNNDPQAVSVHIPDETEGNVAANIATSATETDEPKIVNAPTTLPSTQSNDVESAADKGGESTISPGTKNPEPVVTNFNKVGEKRIKSTAWQDLENEAAQITETDKLEGNGLTIAGDTNSDGEAPEADPAADPTSTHNEIDTTLKQTNPQKPSGAVKNTPKPVVKVVPAFRHVPATQIVKGCIQTVMAVMRTDHKYVNPSRFTEEIAPAEVSLHPLRKEFQKLLMSVDDDKFNRSATKTLSDSFVAEDEDSTNPEGKYASFLDPFCKALKRRDVSAAVTGAVLAALNKFIIYDILTPGNEVNTDLPAEEGIRLIAESLIGCSIDRPSDSVSASDPSAPSQRKDSTNRDNMGASSHHQHGNGEQEQVVLKLLEVAVAAVRYSCQYGNLLQPEMVAALLDTCLHVTHRLKKATSLLRSAAADSCGDLVSTIFHSDVIQVDEAQDGTGRDNSAVRLIRTRMCIFQKLTDLFQISAVPQNRTPGVSQASSPISFVAISALTLLNTALESTRQQELPQEERNFLKTDLFRSLLSVAIDTRDCGILENSIRVVFNLWMCMRHDLKCEFEVFIQSVHLHLLENSNKTSAPTSRWRRPANHSSDVVTAEAREIVLESLLDLLRLEPNILRDLYFNYDCDISCTNLYESIVTALGKTARPMNWINADQQVGNTPVANVGATFSSRAASNISKSSHSVGSVDSTGAKLPTGTPASTPAVSRESSSISNMQNTTAPQQVIGNGSTLLDNTNSRRLAPLNHLNHLALDGMLSVLDSITQFTREDEHMKISIFEHEKENDSWIFEVHHSGETVAVFEEELHSRKCKKHSLQKIIQAFNNNPRDDLWLRLAASEGFLPENVSLSSEEAAKSVATLLFTAQDMDKTKLGNYLSRGPVERYPFEFLVRKEFATLHDFKGLPFPIALRKFLSKFRMPGEAQCIDRIMEVFSKEFYSQQGESSIFKNADAVYVLAFSTIMLNTDLHNKTIKAGERMTREQFVRNNRGINAGEDLDEEFLTDLYNQIKEREIQVRKEIGEFTKKSEHEYFQTAWNGLLSKRQNMPTSIFTLISHPRSQEAGIHDKEMFLIHANVAVQALTGIFMKSWDDSVVVRALRGLQQIVRVASFFELDSVVNDILQIFLLQGREYIISCLALDYSILDENASVATNNSNPRTTAESVEEEDFGGIDTEQPIPYDLLCFSETEGEVDIAGSASHRGLLALDSGLLLFRKYTDQVNEAWPAFIECMCALRDAHALPEGLSELDDFADSNGNVLPLSSYAISSQKALDEHYRALTDKGPKANTKGWLRSFFRRNRDVEEEEATDDGSFSRTRGELSIYTRTLLEVAEAADVDDAVEMGSMKLPKRTICSLLSAVSHYPFEEDPVAEQHAVFSLELASRALLSDRDNAVDLFSHFLATFEGILCRITDENIPSPFVIERIVVAILRSSIHLYEVPELRPNLRASLQLITMTLPKSFIRVIADRMACGMAIILRASFPYFETANEWNFMGDTLDMLANYSISREFVFDGIASTVEYAVPNRNDEVEDDEDHPQLSLEACSSLARILIRFTLGFYKGDLSLTVPAMLCLEKIYRYKVRILIEGKDRQEGLIAEPVDPISMVPDKEFWQNVTVAVYAVCRSSDPDSSRHGLDCFRRVILRTRIDEIPDDKWVAILYLMVNKQPPILSELSRGNTYVILGHLLARVLPVLSHKKDLVEDLEDLISQVAALTGENLRQRKRGGANSPLFERTLQTATYLANHMVSDEWGGEVNFSNWASEAILAELERVGASSVVSHNKKRVKPQNPHPDVEHGGDSVSELSVTEDHGED